MRENQEWLIVGIITSPHGITGKLKIKSLSDFQERFTEPGKRWLQIYDNNPICYELTSGYQKPSTDIYIVSFKGINSRSEAEKFKKYKILVRKDDIPKLKENEFHYNELLNLKVKLLIDNKFEIIGEVVDLITENNNLIAINLYNKKKKVLIPFVDKIVTKVDKKNRFIIIDPPKGLLEL